MDVKQAYKIMQDNCGIEVGDTVKVLREAESEENGWENAWNSAMAEPGDILEVNEIRRDGIHMKQGYSYPFFVLEVVKKAPKSIKISSDYTCKFNDDGSIDVGCQHLDFELIEKIYNQAKEIKG